MTDLTDLKRFILDLVASDRLGVLSTCAAGTPHASLVAFLATDDLRHIIFSTPRATRKYANLSENARVAMLIDNSANRESDFHEAAAVTVTGQARELTDPQRRDWLARFIDKHPYLRDFAESPSCALFMIDVECYRLVRRFQNVMEFIPD